MRWNASSRHKLHTYVVRLRERMREIERTPATRGGRPEKPTGSVAVRDRDAPAPRETPFPFLRSPRGVGVGLRVKMCVWLGVLLGLDLAFLDAD